MICIHIRLSEPFSFAGETGLLLSKVSALTPFFGYAGSKQLTEKKLLRNVFVKGDAYFNTGDLMAEDQEGFICFRDRVGDTFRYSGVSCLRCLNCICEPYTFKTSIPVIVFSLMMSSGLSTTHLTGMLWYKLEVWNLKIFMHLPGREGIAKHDIQSWRSTGLRWDLINLLFSILSVFLKK